MSFGKTVQRLTCHVVVRHLALELEAVRAMSGMGFHPLKARLTGQFLLLDLSTPKGALQWVVDYVDQHGKRHIKTFDRKKDADAYHASVKIDVSRGTHTPESSSITVAEAAALWLKTCENNGVERATLQTYGSTSGTSCRFSVG